MTDVATLSSTDFHRLLAERHEIAVIWGWEDVQSIRPDLDPDQCWHVLIDVERHHDANHGITWHTLEAAAVALFGDEPEQPDEPIAQPILQSTSKE
jgi:hypothetical protein